MPVKIYDKEVTLTLILKTPNASNFVMLLAVLLQELKLLVAMTSSVKEFRNGKHSVVFILVTLLQHLVSI